jgi:hypothetical protein
MKLLRDVQLTAAVFLLVAASACGGEAPPQAAPEAADSEQAAAAERPETASEEIAVEGIDFDPANFADSTNIDNQWLPLKPGTRLVYDGSFQEEGDRIPRSQVFTVTDLTKVINGVRAVVGWDRDYSDGELEEAEIIFLAQDKDGNVWHFGQVVELYEEEGQYVGTSTWIAGMDGAKAGIFMRADPRKGTPAHSQGFAPPPFFWDDHARVHEAGQKTCVPAGCYDNVLVMDEFEPLKPGAHQLKYHAPGVGTVRVGFLGNDPEQEVLELVRVKQLTPEELAEARTEALKIEARAYLYGRTPPSEAAAAG